MNNKLSSIVWTFGSTTLSLLVLTATASATTYYVSRSDGNDNNTGQPGTAPNSGPWKTLTRASIEFAPGDKLLLKRGDTWNEELRPQGNGTPQQPILIGSYGRGKKPVIDRLDDQQDRSGIYLHDQEGFKIQGLEFHRCMTGIYADYSDNCPTKKFIWIEDCYFHDSLKYQHYEDYPRRKIGLGICFFTYERDKRVVLEDITIKNCVFRRLASGVWTNNPDNFNKNASFVYNFANMKFEDCMFEQGYQWQLGIRGVAGGHVKNCVTVDVGENFRSFNGVAGAMFFRCKDWLFEDSEWGYISIGLGSGDGEAFDFEGNCDNMTMRNCLFHDTDGPGFLLCCYASDGHPNRGIVMENCVLNGKSKRPIGLPRCEIVNTTDWTESTWRKCRFYLSEGEALMRVMDPEKDKRTSFHNCRVKRLRDACSTKNLATTAKATSSSVNAGRGAQNVTDNDNKTMWMSASEANPWVQLEFDFPTTINEFKIHEVEGSQIKRYVIQTWDDENSRWDSCFHGMRIGPEFVAPIVTRTTTRVRLLIREYGEKTPAIFEFEAYYDTSTDLTHDELGHVSKAPVAVKPPAPAPPAPPAKVTTVVSNGYPTTVQVGNPNNSADGTGFGAVSYVYRIGKYEVTNQEYCDFLNSNARADTKNLYDDRMAGEFGGILRKGGSGAFTYSVKDGWSQKPINFITWDSGVRYANWLTNKQQPDTTENGGYAITDGKISIPDHAKLAAKSTVCWLLASENEWYKAAYYDPQKSEGGGYWRYPTRTDSPQPTNINSNQLRHGETFAPSAYGTYHQGGNLWEYNDARRGNKVGLRGGSFFLNDNETYLRSSTRYDVLSAKWPNYGIRVVAVGGEPNSKE